MRFAEPQYFWWMLAVVPLVAIFAASRSPTSSFSSGRFLRVHRKGLRLSTTLQTVAFAQVWVMVVLISARPQASNLKETTVMLVRDIVAVVDKSGSMKETISDPDQLAGVKSQTLGGAPAPPKTVRKIDAVRICLQFFVPMRPHDRISLSQFDANTYINWPLSPDHEALMAEIEKLTVAEGDSNFEGPTEKSSNVGCFQGGINHFREMQPGSLARFLIVLTDGEVESADGLDKIRFAELVADLKSMGIKLFVIGVGDSWTADPETDPKGRKTKDIRRLVETVNGRVITVGNVSLLKAAFQEISDSAPSEVRTERAAEWRDLYPQFAFYNAVLVVVLFTCSALVELRL